MVDFLWYRKKIEGAYTDSYGYDVIDEWGRMLPDPGRWPSSRGGKGFSEVAQKVHSMGLKFGIHVMRGLSKQAFNANTLILDTTTVLLFTQMQIQLCAFIYRFKYWYIQSNSLYWKMQLLRQVHTFYELC